MSDKSEPELPNNEQTDIRLKGLLEAIEKEHTPKRLRDLAEQLQAALMKRKNVQ